MGTPRRYYTTFISSRFNFVTVVSSQLPCGGTGEDFVRCYRTRTTNFIQMMTLAERHITGLSLTLLLILFYF